MRGILRYARRHRVLTVITALATLMLSLAVVAVPQQARATIGTNDYPYASGWCHTWNGMHNTPPTTPSTSNCTNQNVDSWGFLEGECTSFVAWRINTDDKYPFTNNMGGGHWGSAYQWKDNDAALGYSHTTTPAIGSVAWWPKGGYHPFGHVAYVDSVTYSGTTPTFVTVEEYNAQNDHGYDTRTIAVGGTDYPAEFLHIHDIPGTPVTAGPDDPIGHFDDMHQVAAGMRLTGWAHDPNTSSPIEVDVYEGRVTAKVFPLFTGL
jgi:surface antigen